MSAWGTAEPLKGKVQTISILDETASGPFAISQLGFEVPFRTGPNPWQA
jgi:hypothetical protein